MTERRYYRDIAEKYQARAKKKEEVSEGSEKGPTHGEISELYEEAGDAWADARDKSKAIKDYKLAIDYAYNKEKKREIRKKMEKLRQSRSGLERRLALGVAAIIAFSISLVFVSINFTGYAVSGETQDSFAWVGITLFVIGLALTLFYLKSKKQIAK